MKETKCRIALAVFGTIAALSAFTAQGADDLRKESEQALANFQKTDSTLKTFADQSADPYVASRTNLLVPANQRCINSDVHSKKEKRI